MLMRLIDFAKSLQITGFFTSLSNDVDSGTFGIEPTEMHVSSLMDAWLILKNVEGNGERNRAFSVIKVRGVAHSNQLREFVLSAQGIQLLDVYKGREGVLYGSARMAQESSEIIGQLTRSEEIERKKRDLESKRRLMENGIAVLKEQYARDEEEMKILIRQDISREKVAEQTKKKIAVQRQVGRRPGVRGKGG